MVGAGERRVVAVVGGEHERGAVGQGGLEGGERGVDLLQRRRVARRVVAVPVQLVEVDQVGPDERRLVGRRGVADGVERVPDAVRVARRLDLLVYAGPAEERRDLADADRPHARVLEPVQQRRGVGEE